MRFVVCKSRGRADRGHLGATRWVVGRSAWEDLGLRIVADEARGAVLLVPVVPLRGGKESFRAPRCDAVLTSFGCGKKCVPGVLGAMNMSRAGFEPATPCLKGRCSTD